MGTLLLKAHDNRYEIDGRRHDFEAPVFLTSISTMGERGLFIAVTDYDRPGERIYLHMPLAYAMQLMGGWIAANDGVRAADLLIPFALQNIDRLKHFVMGVEKEHLTGEGRISSLHGVDVRVIKLRMPNNIERLND